MLRGRVITGAILLALLCVGVAQATGLDHGRRLTGPICISLKPNGPVRAGTMRSVAVSQMCHSDEVRKNGVAGLVGPKGATGASGVAGATGPQGPAGANGTTPTFNTRALCLVPDDDDAPVLYGDANWEVNTDTQYSVLNRACTDEDVDAVPLVVVTP